jgi:hypothetical protein
VLLPDPPDAEGQLVELLASELRSVMEDREVGDEAGAAAITEWLEWRRQKDLLPLWAQSAANDEETQALLMKGFTSNDESVSRLMGRSAISKSNAYLRATTLFAPDAQSCEQANDELAMRFSLRSNYSKPDRIRHLGTIVRNGGQLSSVCPTPLR